MLTISNLSFAYGDQRVIHEFSNQILSSDLIHLCGENGSGKSTLLKLLAGILVPSQGQIHGKSRKAYNGHRLGLDADLTVVENLSLGFYPVALSHRDELLTQTQLMQKKDQPLRTLSKGQAEKLALIASILIAPKLWLMDEPFANLDQVSETWLWQQIDALRAKGAAIIFTAHQRDFRERGAKVWTL